MRNANRSPFLRPLPAMLHAMCGIAALLPLTPVRADQHDDQAGRILQGSGVRGGLVVHIGESDGKLTAALGAGEGYLVQGLGASPRNIDGARAHIESLGRYGPVTAVAFDGSRLPYAAGIVNLIVAEGPDSEALLAEAKRVLAPRGVLMVREGKQGAWRKQFTQPVPEAIDEWTHYRYDPSNNNVAQDSVVDAPRSMKWEAGPEMLRHHDHLPSLSAMVTAKGRLFYIFDEGPPSSIMLPPKWKLTARDAFSGVKLWQRNIEKWHPHLWPLKSMPATLPRRLVSVGDRVFVTLGIDAPVSQLSAADGSEIRAYAGSDRCEEIIVKGDTLLALRLTGKGPLDDMKEENWKYLDRRVTKFPYAAKLASGITSPLWLHAERRLVAYDVETGRERWRVDGKFAPMSLATDGERVCFHDGRSIVALDSGTGKRLWTSEAVPIWKEYFAWYGASLVMHEDVVVFSGGEGMTWYNAGTPKGASDTMTAFSAVDGKKLWSAEHPPSGYRSPEDLVVAQGLVWAPDCTHRSSAVLRGLDLHTGKVEREFTADYTHGFHHRCHPGKATELFLLVGKVGINMIRFDGKGASTNHWVRGACGYGFMPANGMIYAAPDPCNCYPQSKVNGFVALAPKVDRGRASASDPITKGPAYQAIQGGAVVAAPADSWPTYRRDAARRGSTSERLPAKLTPAWSADVGGAISAPVIVGGRVYLSSIESHRVVALDAESGRQVWTRTVGGRVDSPPTIVRIRKEGETTDLCVFGCADGRVYCVRAVDGELAWRRRLAPTTEQIVSKGSIESLWPVHGSVLLHEGALYAVAGRSSFLDGGIHLFGLDPVSGDVKVRKNRALGAQEVSGMNAEPAIPDVLAAFGDRLYMKSMAFDLQGEPAAASGRHIFAPSGFLDDTWFHRAFYVYATGWAGGCGGFGKTGNSNPSGRIMVADDGKLYAFGRTKYGWGSAFEYKLYAAPVQNPVAAGPANEEAGKRRGKAKPATVKTGTAWSVDSPILVRAMVAAGGEILIAGPKKLYEEAEAIQEIDRPEIQKAIEAQDRARHGKAQLHGVAASDGQLGRNLTLPSMPVWNGMAVAAGALYVSCEDGTVRCLK